LGGICGCGNSKKLENSFGNQTNYKKMMDMQKQKSTVNVENEFSEKIPEMTVEEYVKLGDAFNNQNNERKAFINYYKALRLDPDQNEVRCKLGFLLIRRGMIDDALKEFVEILKNDSKNALAYEGKGMALFALGKLEESKQNFREAINLNHKTWQSHTYIGIICDHQGMYDAAISEYQKGIAINPKSYISFNNLGISYYLKGDYNQSIKALRTALKIRPEKRSIYNNLGLSLYKMKEYDEAFIAFKNCGDKASAYNNMGYLYMTEQKHKEALEAFQKAIETRPKHYAKAQENKEAVKIAISRPSDDFKQNITSVHAN
jgi:tetratricopeptide (TPR) repeat protein